ncbi:MAG: hypothetical protein A2126_01265 [Candidatus Woykebacteria bacterium GWB1_45_5]|uniref:Uncharacterized protein n=2 Tax=Candidatus Woykeibacteriota TaxID=1817899 RepID=A0A1G1W4S3_9BACT|nr:MAG: hypothetical protein A2113_02230 [Candidatus Woykebacteria bacterium GWA1_44_8]OGY22805.1 MAG: hypothetical protein A2126_01265 [Candidatus Woykebacteria bacterium GWB1_45_5]
MDTPLAQTEIKPHKFNFNKIIFSLLLGIFLVVSAITAAAVLDIQLPFTEKLSEQGKSVELTLPEGWNLYKSKDFNYQVGYPKEWSWQESATDENGAARTIFGPNVDQLKFDRISKIDSIRDFVIIIRIATPLSLDNWLKEHLNSETQSKKVMIDSNQAVQINKPVNPDVVVPSITTFIKHENDLLIITVNISPNKEEVKDIYNKMLSNLKFTSSQEKPAEKVDTSGWKTYQSSQIGYSIKLPAGWREIEEDTGRKIFRSYSSVKRGQGGSDEYGEIETELNIIVQPLSEEDRKLWEELKKTSIGSELESDGQVMKKIKNLKLDGCDAIVFYGEQTIRVTYGITCVGGSKSISIGFTAETSEIYEKNQAIYDAILSSFKFNQLKL